MTKDAKLDSSFGIMDSTTQENGLKIKSMEPEFGNHPMEMFIWGSG
jgi:hypothetical protein